MDFVFCPQDQEQGSDNLHGETDEFYQSAPTSGPASHVQQSIRRRGGISAEHVSEEEATSYVKKVGVRFDIFYYVENEQYILLLPITYYDTCGFKRFEQCEFNAFKVYDSLCRSINTIQFVNYTKHGRLRDVKKFKIHNILQYKHS